MSNLGINHGLVVYCQDKLDEITTCAPTTVCEIKNGYYKTYIIKPEDFGFARSEKADLIGGTPQENAEITQAILRGEKGPRYETVLMNAGAGFYIAGKAASISEGVKLASEIINSGKAVAKLEEFKVESNK
jgi:anthranilate phosphoribosyltransferase